MGVWIPAHAVGSPTIVRAMISRDEHGLRVAAPQGGDVAVWQAVVDCHTGALSFRDADVISAQGRRLGHPRSPTPSIQPSDALLLCRDTRPGAVAGGLGVAVASMRSAHQAYSIPSGHPGLPSAAERAAMLSDMKAARH